MKSKIIYFIFLCIFLVACQAKPSNAGLSSLDKKTCVEVSVATLKQEQLYSNTSSIESSSEEVIGLNLPVANVSPKYAKNAQRILETFYNANDLLPESIPTDLTDTFDKQKHYHLLT